MKKNNFKIAYLAHGRAGNEYFDLLINYLDKPVENLQVYTYDSSDNQELINKCSEQGINCKTINVNKDLAELQKFNPDLIACIHYRHLVKKDVLDTAKCGGINLHPSLLPKYRGTFSAPWVVINREKQTGITYHFMNEKFDDGNIIKQVKLSLNGTETAYRLFHQLIDLGKENFIDVLNKGLVQKTKGQKQEGLPSYYGRKLPYDGIINPSWSDERKDAFIRAMYFPPFKGALLPTDKGLVEVKSFEEYQKMEKTENLSKPLVVSTMAFTGETVEEIIETAIENGFALEFSSGLPYQKDMIEKYLFAPLKKYIHNYFPAPEEPFVLNLASANEEIRQQSIQHSKQGLELAVKSNCAFYSVHAGFCVDPQTKELGEIFERKRDFDRKKHLELFKKSLIELLETADNLMVDLCIENNVVIKENLDLYGQNLFLCAHYKETIEIIKEINHPRLKLLLDTAHLKVSSNTLSFNLEEAVQKLQSYIGAVHHSDNNGLRDTNLSLTDEYWFLPFMEKFRDIVHVLEVKNLSPKQIENQLTLLENAKRYSAVTN